ncbi:MAG: carboxypeptidase regulatory-like domain-containing protein [Pirellulaceae bacterium]|nr:carboxypeptidase regulatory-like domain-containing protein [Pirellulaceae bacterium]
MLLGYVSDERYVALADVCIEFIGASGRSYETRSRASGAVHLELPAGRYRVILQKPGYGAKFSDIELPVTQPHQFRLLSDGLLGYAWPKWVRANEESEFRVHSVEQFHLELWRYGWQPEFVRNLGWHDEHGPRAMMQITPDGDYTQIGVQWNKVGYSSDTHRQYVRAPEKSGLYYFRANTNSGTRFSFPWIVAPAQPTAKLAVLASNITWNAYNPFGGRSNYIHADQLPSTPTVNSRYELPRYQDPEHGTWGYGHYAPLSFERPELNNHIDFDEAITDPIEGRHACHLAPAEWRLLGWLEREHIEYDYYAETQFDDGTLDLSAYKVLVTAVHPEYWTRRMYDALKRWVFEQGGKLLYLGGNGLNCEVEIDTQAVMTCHNGSIESLWASGMGNRDSRFAMRHESEANLLGVVFTPTGAMTGAPYRVVDGQHWVFDGTGLATGDIFGEHSLHRRCPGGASGHETDKISPSSPKNVHRLAKGMNIDDGGADMVIFDTPSGGGVFSVGSINYCASLPIDPHVSQLTKNVLNRWLE